jgi:hypothetical protein
MKSISILVVAFLLAMSPAFGAEESEHEYVPAAGFVPDAETAIRIAVAVWEPIYGRAKIEGEKPHHATLKNGVWTVEGSLPKGMFGGVAIAEIRKSDALCSRLIRRVRQSNHART